MHSSRYIATPYAHIEACNEWNTLRYFFFFCIFFFCCVIIVVGVIIFITAMTAAATANTILIIWYHHAKYTVTFCPRNTSVEVILFCSSIFLSLQWKIVIIFVYFLHFVRIARFIVLRYTMFFLPTYVYNLVKCLKKTIENCFKNTKRNCGIP